jgi:hypothetical protein
MIAKRIQNPRATASKTVRIKRLTDYILDMDVDAISSDADVRSKCIYSGARGFLCTDTRGRQSEMMALATGCIRSKDPIRHYVFSYKEFEHPTPQQIEEAVDIFLTELGLVGHQVIYGLHDDTNNVHGHMAVNLVHPESAKVVKPNGGFDIEGLHRAVARIEHKQGWSREPNGRYFVQSDGSLSSRPPKISMKPEPSQINRDIECQTGTKSAERIGIETAGPILRTAKTWQELHLRLGQKGMRYEKVGSGAVIFVGTTAVKASTCDRNGGLAKLVKKLGAWSQQEVALTELIKRAPEPILPSQQWRNYVQLKSKHYENKRLAKELLKTKHVSERSELFRRSKAERNEIYKVSWQGVGILRVAFSSVLAARHAVAKIELREHQAIERKKLGNQYAPWPNFERWLEIESLSVEAQGWRYRSNSIGVPNSIHGDRQKPCEKHDLRDFSAHVVGTQVHYQHITRRDIGFIDRGRSIVLPTSIDADTVLAALQLAAQKWGQFTVNGSQEYKSTCVLLAATYGFKILNPELQDEISTKRDFSNKFNKSLINLSKFK